MFGSMKPGAHVYANVAMETGVGVAAPHQLVVMLFDGANLALQLALKEMKAGRISDKCRAIAKAVTIINEGLRASLDKQAGGEIARNLDDLYAYISTQIMLANIHNDDAKLEQAQRLLADLSDAWRAIQPTPALTIHPLDSLSSLCANG
jgi:flagellar protein FliS